MKPLAMRMRPVDLSTYRGQAHLLDPGKPLRQALERGEVHSMILWGPPGTGKTTLAHLLATHARACVENISAVLAGVKEVRAAIDIAQQNQSQFGQRTVLFIDEIHRFNKSQQDALLPFVEDGTITLIGATTENPSFALNNALLSRARVYVLKALTQDDLLGIIEQALNDPKHGLADRTLDFPDDLRLQLAIAADGDARRCLNYLALLSELSASEGSRTITPELLETVLQTSLRRFDKGGDIFYDQISALHKSVRGSSPDAALYWFSRMIDGGCDPLYIARRVVRMASEDIGNADPRALTLALNAWEAYERLGSPEGELAIAQAIAYLASTAKSNAVYTAFNAAYQDAKNSGSLDVPLHLRNAPTTLMKSLDYGKDYRYAHDEENAYAAGEQYLPDDLRDKCYYYPVDRGLESKIKQKLDRLRALD